MNLHSFSKKTICLCVSKKFVLSNTNFADFQKFQQHWLREPQPT
jgi:hypothetical protein